MPIKFLSDKPVNDTTNVLWLNDDMVYQDMASIADHIVSSVVEAAPGDRPSMTFAVYGKWGMGKSSAVNLMLELCKQSLERSNPGSYQLNECRFEASQHQASGRTSPKEALARDVLKAYIGQEMIEFMETIPTAYARAMDYVHARDIPDKIKKFLMFDAFVAEALKTNVFEVALDGWFAKSPDKVRVIVIDDLDRCDPTFIWNTLMLTQHWVSAIGGLYFIIAIDRDKLRAAVDAQQSTMQSKDFALEKYIQYFITIPEMSRQRFSHFVQRIVPEHLSMLARHSDIIYYGLKVKTPRSIKRFLNAVMPRLERLLLDANVDSLLQRTLWTQMLAYTWPEFYRIYNSLLDQKDAEPTPPLEELFGACEQYVLAQSDEKLFEFYIDRIRTRSVYSWEQIYDGDRVDYDLIYFLGSASLNPHQSKLQSTDQVLKADSATSLTLDTLSSFGGGLKDDQPKTAIEINAEIFRLMNEAQMARFRNDNQRVLELANNAFALVETNRDLYTVIADQQRMTSVMGDIAGYLSQLDLDDEACRLFEYTFQFEAEPRVLINNVSRYIAAGISMEAVGRLPRMVEMFELISSPEYTQYSDQPRMVAMNAALIQLANKHNVPIKLSGFSQVRDFFAKQPENRMAFAAAVQDTVTAKNYQALREIARIRMQAIVGQSFDQIYTSLRILGDGLAGSSEHDDEFEAMEIYRLFFKIIVCNPVNPEAGDIRRDAADIYHNYATLLYKHDYDDIAGYFWYEAYRLAPKDGSIVRMYARYLSRSNRQELAQKVAQSIPLQSDEIGLVSSSKKLPASFMRPENVKWWMEYIGLPYDTDLEYPLPPGVIKGNSFPAS